MATTQSMSILHVNMSETSSKQTVKFCNGWQESKLLSYENSWEIIWKSDDDESLELAYMFMKMEFSYCSNNSTIVFGKSTGCMKSQSSSLQAIYCNF